MEHVITAPHGGIVRGVTMAPGDVVREGYPIVFIQEAEVAGGAVAAVAGLDPDHIRDDLRESYDRHAFGLDENRPDAVARRRKLGYRMPRENIDRLVDPGSFKEYWPLVVARQHQRNTIEALRKNTPGDGVVAGMASINGTLFDETRSRAVVVHYDYTVLAGTQGHRNHYKQDRIFELAQRFKLPLVLFGEGGGGRPGEDDIGPRVAVDTHTFTTFSQLSGLVPLVAIVNGRTFAGNTALVACSDVIIATEGSTLGMGGPAMIEGGGLGIYTPEEVGPMSVQVPNGVVDILVTDEDEAVDVAKKYLSYFQGTVSAWDAPDQRRLRHAVPENRLRLYEHAGHEAGVPGRVAKVQQPAGRQDDDGVAVGEAPLVDLRLDLGAARPPARAPAPAMPISSSKWPMLPTIAWCFIAAMCSAVMTSQAAGGGDEDVGTGRRRPRGGRPGKPSIAACSAQIGSISVTMTRAP